MIPEVVMLVTKTKSEPFFEEVWSSLLSKVTMWRDKSLQLTLFSELSCIVQLFPWVLWLNLLLNFRTFNASFFNNRISLNSKQWLRQGRLLGWCGNSVDVWTITKYFSHTAILISSFLIWRIPDSWTKLSNNSTCNQVVILQCSGIPKQHLFSIFIILSSHL